MVQFVGAPKMSSSDSEDSFDYSDYTLLSYLQGPPLIKKRSRLIAAVVQNEVGVLSDLLDSPRWYNAQDNDGYSLLQIAILQQNMEVFDYMLSIPDFPLEYVNLQGDTALGVAFQMAAQRDASMRDHFAYELIQKGACIDRDCYKGNTALHCAIQRPYIGTFKLLIQKGVDVNRPNYWGLSPLSFALLTFSDLTEVVPILLAYGAEPSVRDFENSVERDAPFEVQEALFLYIFDEYSNLTLELDVILKLADAKSALFYQVIEYTVETTIKGGYGYYCHYPHFRVLCSISIDCLVSIIQKFGRNIKKALLLPKSSHMNHFRCTKAICLENLDLILKSELKAPVMTFISTLKSSRMFVDLLNHGYDELATTQLYCYLLGAGLHIEERDLQLVYKEFGYCELFKILLHMDVEIGIEDDYTKIIMPVFVYDVRMNLQHFFQNYSKYSMESCKELLHYFSHPKLNEICLRHGDEPGNRQQVPLLAELARNAFRNFSVKQCNIRTCKEFYTLINRLPISNICKKIITYETKLY